MKTSLLKFGVATALAAGSFTAQADFVTFWDIADANGSSALFDPLTTSPDAINGNLLNIGISSFKTTALGGSIPGIAADTLKLKITAPTNMVITKLTYVESGAGTISGPNAVGAIAESVQLIANGVAKTPLGASAFGGPGTYNWGPLSQVFDFGAGVAEVDFAVINTLFAFALTGSASNEKTSATIEATLAPIPLPPAAWMLGSALVGLATVGRRKLG